MNPSQIVTTGCVSRRLHPIDWLGPFRSLPVRVCANLSLQSVSQQESFSHTPFVGLPECVAKRGVPEGVQAGFQLKYRPRAPPWCRCIKQQLISGCISCQQFFQPKAPLQDLPPQVDHVASPSRCLLLPAARRRRLAPGSRRSCPCCPCCRCCHCQRLPLCRQLRRAGAKVQEGLRGRRAGGRRALMLSGAAGSGSAKVGTDMQHKAVAREAARRLRGPAQSSACTSPTSSA